MPLCCLVSDPCDRHKKLTGAEHRREAERLLSEASFVRSPDHPQPVHRDGSEMPPSTHAALIARAHAHAILASVPQRGDHVEAWLKRQRDRWTEHTRQWTALDNALDDYRLHADCGTPLDQPTPLFPPAPTEGGEPR
ncbi:hypothetical protein [Acrocarpospora sp. B8E8]|uniref:hypothetical protein n=1 Tax=Acrocarpospora sp. B8E8 TaxID=3153572 RepID=UPI00325E05A2